jgi:predicted HD superfamily hydrolase involved in NAD metabolism
MDQQQALERVKTELTGHRFKHTIGVMETAVDLARIYGADLKKAEIAAIFHDFAKFRPKNEMREIIIEQNLDQRLLLHNEELWHAPVGAYLVEKEVGINDIEIIDAIRFHTSGRPNMSLLEKIIYVADYIEPGRHFPGVEEVRELAKTDLEEALIKALQNTVIFLMKKKQTIFPDTFLAYNDLVKK